jgi:hypothetical protein
MGEGSRHVIPTCWFCGVVCYGGVTIRSHKMSSSNPSIIHTLLYKFNKFNYEFESHQNLKCTSFLWRKQNIILMFRCCQTSKQILNKQRVTTLISFPLLFRTIELASEPDIQPSLRVILLLLYWYCIYAFLANCRKGACGYVQCWKSSV